MTGTRGDGDPARGSSAIAARFDGPHAEFVAALVSVAAFIAIATLLLVGLTVRDERAPSLDDLVAPLRPGASVVPGYLLGAARRGDEGDVVLTVAPPTGAPAVEIHILDRGRWEGIGESQRYGVAYESPRTHADEATAVAVVDAILARVRANESRVAVPVEALRLPGDTHRPSALERMLGRLAGPWRIPFGILLVVGVAAFASTRARFRGSALLLFALGLALRLPHLGLPFERDQDVQRLFTGAEDLVDILTGVGLRDRHPPLYFVVLHVVEWAGQSEAVARFPAAFAGACAGPLLVAYGALAGRSPRLAALAGLVATVSPVLVLRAREVSSIPLFALVLLAMAASVARDLEHPTEASRSATIGTHATSFYLYYTAPFAVLGELAVLAYLRSLASARRVVIGAALGAPPLALLVATMLRDHGARVAAAERPDLAWGHRGAAETLVAGVRELADAVGAPVLAFAVVAVAWGVRRRDPFTMLPAAIVVANVVGIALVAPIARVQPYYAIAVVPCVLAALLAGAPRGRASVVATPAIALAAALTVASALLGAGRLYRASPNAFAPRFVATIARSGIPRIVTVAHYDATLLAYYLGRSRGRRMRWSSLRSDGRWFEVLGTPYRLLPLVEVHRGDDPEAQARDGLRAARRGGPFLVVDRPSFEVASIRAGLAPCVAIDTSPVARLLRCPGNVPPAETEPAPLADMPPSP